MNHLGYIGNKMIYRGAPELRSGWLVPVPAGTNKKSIAGTGTLSFSERQKYQTFLCLTKVHSRKKFGLHKKNVHLPINTS
jgi:hypothetical protein